MKNKTILLGTTIIAALILFGTAAFAAMPQETCSNVATKIDEWVQKWVEHSYNTKQRNPCSGQIEPAVWSFGPNWSYRYQRYVFSDGSIKGQSYQGYLGGKVTYYTICADGRAEVDGRSFGYYGYGSIQDVCSTIN